MLKSKDEVWWHRTTIIVLIPLIINTCLIEWIMRKLEIHYVK